MKALKTYICCADPDPLPGTKGRKRYIKADFEIFGQMADKYRPAELKKVSGSWYVEFQYRYPEELRPVGKQFKRFRITKQLNYIRKKYGEEAAEAYAKELIFTTNLSLKNGANPFNKIKPKAKETINLNSAIELFLTAKRRDLKKKTIQDYQGYLNVFKNWGKGILSLNVSEITQDHLEAFLSQTQDDKKWSNRTYNNYKGLLFMLFEFIRTKKLIKENPAADLKAQKTIPNKHTYYDKQLAIKVKNHMKENDPFMHDFCQFIYYSCIRPKTEARLIQVRNIDMDRRLIKLNGKTGYRYVPICNELYAWLMEINIEGQHQDRYLFGSTLFATSPAGLNYFSNRYKKIKDALGLTEEHTIYSWKHTRCIDLVMSGLSAIETMQVTGHSDFTSFEKYLRDLGAAMSGKVIGDTVRF